MNKYENILKLIDKGIANDIENFSEKMANAIFELEDINKTLKYNDSQWNEICKFCKQEQSLPLYMAFIKAKGVPVQYIKEIMNEMDYFTRINVLAGDSIDDEIIEEVLKLYDINTVYNAIMDNGYSFSQNALYHLCTLSHNTLKELLYVPFQFIDENNDIVGLLKNIINDGFENDIETERFNNIIANNEKLPEKIRDLAFDSGCNTYFLKKFTPHMIDEIYRSCTDAIFSFTPETTEEKEAQHQAERKLIDLISKGVLSESHQIDFINHMKTNPDIAVRAFETLMLTTKSEDVLIEALNYIDRKNIFNLISDNKKTLTPKVIEKAMKCTSTRTLDRAFITTVFSHPFNKKYIINEFLKHNDISIARALLTSLKSTDDIVDTVLKNMKKSNYLEELSFLKDLRDTCKHLNNGQQILKYTATQFIIQDMVYQTSDVYQNDMTSCHRVLQELRKNNERKWLCTPQADLDILKNAVKELSEKYPHFKKPICDKILLQIKNLEIDQKIVIRFPEVFESNFEKNNPIYSERIPFTHIVFDKLYKLSKTELTEMSEQLKEISCINVKQLLTDVIEGFVSNDTLSDADDVYKIAYKFVDLYNVASECKDMLVENYKSDNYDRELPF